MQRIIKTLYLKPDPQLIEKYQYVHDNIWPEIKEGILKAGIHNMEIYLYGNLAVMIVEIEDSIDADEAFSKLATYPHQQEWEDYVAQFQNCECNDSSADKWKTMKKIFSLI